MLLICRQCHRRRVGKGSWKQRGVDQCPKHPPTAKQSFPSSLGARVTLTFPQFRRHLVKLPPSLLHTRLGSQSREPSAGASDKTIRPLRHLLHVMTEEMNLCQIIFEAAAYKLLRLRSYHFTIPPARPLCSSRLTRTVASMAGHCSSCAYSA